MLDKKGKRGEAGWIAEEAFEDPALELRSKCLAIDDQVANGVLDLEDALEVYEVSLDEYARFFATEEIARAQAKFNSKSPEFQILAKLKFAHQVYNYSTGSIYSDLATSIGHQMTLLEDTFEHGQVK